MNWQWWGMRSSLTPMISQHGFTIGGSWVKVSIPTNDVLAHLTSLFIFVLAPFHVTVVGVFRSTDSSIIVGFNGVVGFSALPKVLTTTDETPISGQWYAITIPSSSSPLYGTQHSSSSAWLFVSDQQQLQSREKWTVRIRSNDVYPISSAMTVEPDHIWAVPVKVTDALGNYEEDKLKKKVQY